VVLKVKEDLAGTKGKCPACKGTLNVPTLEEAAKAAAAPLGATETAAATSAEDTGAIKVPTKTKTAKAAGAAGASLEANGESAHAPRSEAPSPTSIEPPPPPRTTSPLAESATDDLNPPNGQAPPKAEGKSRLKMPDADSAPAAEKPPAAAKKKLRMSETDSESSVAPAATPEGSASPEAQGEAPASAAAPTEPAKDAPAKDASAKDPGAKDEFDLDSFLMEGPKPKALPPVGEQAPGKKAPGSRPGSGRRLSMSDDETNVPGPSETLPPPNKARGSAADSALSALTGGAGTASSAKDLLARASQEGRARASQMPDEKRERFDFAGAITTIAREYGLHVVGTVALCAVLYFGMNYMLEDSADLPPLADVYGKVTLKGQAVPGVVVNFTPVGTKDNKEGGQKVKKGAPRSASALTDQDGNYELMYMEGVPGAVVGQNRVWIAPQSPEDFKKIPGNYQSAGTSGDIREVKETGGEQNIELSK
jgi:hypothetical protein